MNIDLKGAKKGRGKNKRKEKKSQFYFITYFKDKDETHDFELEDIDRQYKTQAMSAHQHRKHS